MIKLEENTKANFAIVKAGTKSLSTGKRAGSITSVDWRGSDIEQRNKEQADIVSLEITEDNRKMK